MFHSCQINSTDNNEIELTPDSTKVVDNEPKVLQIKPGDYFELYAGVDESNYLTAFYQSKYGDPSCCYFIQGSLLGQSSLTAFNPFTNNPPVEAVFSVFGEEMLLKIRGPLSQKCDAQLFDQVGYPIVLDIQKDWQQIRIVAQGTNLLDEKEGEQVIERIKKDQILGLIKKENGWAFVECIEMNGQVGWIKESFFEPLLNESNHK